VSFGRRRIAEAGHIIGQTPMPGARGRLLAALLVAVCVSGRAAAQPLPVEPLVLGDGRVTVGGDVAATFSCSRGPERAGGCAGDETGFFNYTDYEHSALRMLRLDLNATVKAGDRVSFVGELRTENADAPEVYALYARIRPWRNHPLYVHAGRVPPTFGAFARRPYASANLLIGYPLAYQYLTSLRPDALPADTDELLRMHGRGWLSNFSVGSQDEAHGLPLVSALRWDTGVQVQLERERVGATMSVTTGTVSNPLVSDDNGGKQLAGRGAVRPTPGLVLALSAARGPYIARSAVHAASAADRGPFTQTAWGADAEYSRDHYLVRFEAIRSAWQMPLVSVPALDELSLTAFSTSLEGRYKIAPGFYLAARWDHLAFSDIQTTQGLTSWEAPVTRLEVGGGYSLQRNLLFKMSYQYNTRATSRFGHVHVAAAQLVYWL
jgi:hypothetical protein